MPKIVATFQVVDVERWLSLKEENAAVVAPFATDVTTFVALDGSNNVGMTMDVHDMAGMQAGLASPSPEMLATEERLGVIRPIVAYMEK
jgi:hypothetical protein